MHWEGIRMNAYTAWTIVTIAIFILVAFVVAYTGSLLPLWLVLLPFMISIKESEVERELDNENQSKQ